MKKLKNKGGFTLIEMMAALLILVLLVVGMGHGMEAAGRVYAASTFESESATLAGILNTSLGDILRYSFSMRENPGVVEDSAGNRIQKDDVAYFFTSLDYGIRDGYFVTPQQADGTFQGVLQMKNLHNANVVELVNAGAYPSLVVSNFEITYVAPGAEIGGETVRGGYFQVTYDIFQESDPSRCRSVEYIVRRLSK